MKMRWNLFDEEYGEFGKIVIKPRLDEHSNTQASDTELGHVKIDNSTIIKDSDDKIKVSDSFKSDILSESNTYTDSQITTLDTNKVDKVNGKQLSTEDFTTALKNKLEAIDPLGGGGSGLTLADIAYSGDYSDLINSPILGTVAELNVDDVLPNQFEVNSEQDMLSLTLKRGDTVVRIDEDKTYIAKTDNVASISDFTEIKSPSSIPLISSVNGQIGDVILDKSDVGLSDVTNESKVTMFDNPNFTGVPTAPTANSNVNNQQIATTEFVQNVVNSKQYTKSDIGLSNVDNTSDLDKPISIAMQNALDDKVDESVVNAISGNVNTLQSDFDTHVNDSNAHTINQISGLQNILDGKVNEIQLDSHINDSVVSVNGVHNIRYYNNKIGVFVDGTWKEIESSEGVVKVSGVKNFTGSSSNDGSTVSLIWVNPTNIEYIRTELYVSNTDISNLELVDVMNVANLVVNDDTSNSYIQNTSHGEQLFFKIYAIHNTLGNELYSSPESINIVANDNEPPNIVTNVSVKASDETLTITWSNPTDLDFSTVRLMYSTIDNINGINDGVVAYNGGGNSTIITGLTNGTPIYLRFFTLDVNGNINDDISMKYIGTPQPYIIYGVRIDETNSNPESALTYTDDAIGFNPARMNFTTDTFDYGSWQDKFPFNEIKPCTLNDDGTVNYYLNPNDYTQKLDGSPSDITSGNDGDVMVEFPKIYWKFERISNFLDIKFSNAQVDAGYKCLAHTKVVNELDKIYIGAYLGFEENSKLRSLSGKLPTVNKTISQFRTLAQVNSANHDQIAYYQLLMLQVLYIVMFKDRNSQSALGRGYVDGNSSSISTGGTNTKGLFYGESTGKKQVKFCGIEDFYGNCYYWIDGFFSDANRNILIGTENFNDTGSGYTNYGQGASSNINGYIGSVQGSTNTGFIIKTTNGSETTHYSDYGHLLASCLPLFGGHWTNGSAAGTFYLFVNSSASYAHSSLSARLLCR